LLNNILVHAVHLVSKTHIIRHRRPSFREALIGHASQQERVARRQFIQLVLRNLIVPELEAPAAMLELLSSARVFHYAVQGHELRNDYPSHATSFPRD